MSTDATPAADTSPAALPPLPDDLVVCHRMIQELLTTLREQRHENESLRQRLDQLLRRLYGPRAERVDPAQLALFAELLQAETPPPPAPEPEEASSRRSKPHGRRKPPGQLPRERRVYELSEAERRCPCCGDVRVPISAETSEQLDFRPASLLVIEHARITYACQSCAGQLATAPKPPQPIDKGLPGPGLLAQVVVSKYHDHLPLHRQERIFERQGFLLQRSTTCQWMAACAELLKPLYVRMVARVLSSKVIHADDTPVPVLDETRTTTRRGHLWDYLGDRNHPYNVFDFMPNHSRDGPVNFLRGFRGFLQADAYSGYETLYKDGAIVEVACWAHARRYFYEAKDSDAARAHQALAFIRQLYVVEDQGRDLDSPARATLRQQQARPILDTFRDWLERQRSAADNPVLPKSPMGQAITYTRTNWEALGRYTSDGDLAIDNNAAERALRAVVTGRKNWLFAGSDAGGRTAAILYSFTSTCQRHKLDSFVFLRDLFTRLPTHPPDHLDDLLPDRWAAAATSPMP
jgi:transposase